MYEASNYGIHRNLSAVLAAAIVALSGLVFDQAHLAAAPEGVIEVGEPIAIETPMTMVALPEVVVTARRA